MKNSLKIFLVASLTLLIFSCARVPHRQVGTSVPIIRVGLLENVERIEFDAQANFVIKNIQNEKAYPQTETGKWTVNRINTQETNGIYRVQLFKSSDKSKVEMERGKYYRRQLSTEMLTLGDALQVGKTTIVDKRQYSIVLDEKFETELDAQLFIENDDRFTDAKIIKEPNWQSNGTLVFVSPSKKLVKIDGAVRLSGISFTVQNIPVGSGFHFERTENRVYKSDLEFRINENGNLLLVNVIPLTTYLEGVVPGEMPPSFPLEALKAQAIAARTFLLYNFGKKHPSKLYDVCDDVHCQAYKGIVENDDKVKQAVLETKGMVIQHDGKLCDTPYSAVCGGHTEHAENVWASDGAPYLKGVFDTSISQNKLKALNLSKEQLLRKWLKASPKMYCNVKKFGAPSFSAYAEKYYRWSVEYTRQELEKILRQKSDEGFGQLIDLIAVKRGVSGRIIELQVRGTEGSFIIKHELNIRKALSENALYSGCFIVDRIGNENGLPQSFKFTGAGFGHGVGMCQIGASMMAQDGKNCVDILTHYYQNTRVVPLY